MPQEVGDLTAKTVPLPPSQGEATTWPVVLLSPLPTLSKKCHSQGVIQHLSQGIRAFKASNSVIRGESPVQNAKSPGALLVTSL